MALPPTITVPSLEWRNVRLPPFDSTVATRSPVTVSEPVDATASLLAFVRQFTVSAPESVTTAESSGIVNVLGAKSPLFVSVIGDDHLIVGFSVGTTPPDQLDAVPRSPLPPIQNGLSKPLTASIDLPSDETENVTVSVSAGRSPALNVPSPESLTTSQIVFSSPVTVIIPNAVRLATSGTTTTVPASTVVPPV